MSDLQESIPIIHRDQGPSHRVHRHRSNNEEIRVKKYKSVCVQKFTKGYESVESNEGQQSWNERDGTSMQLP